MTRKNRKSVVIGFRITEDERQLLDRVVELAGAESDGEVIRKLIRGAAVRSESELSDFMRVRQGRPASGHHRTNTAFRPIPGPQVVPILDSVPAGVMSFRDPSIVATEHLVLPDTRCAERAFALRVTGDSMTDWRGGGIKDGDFVVVHEQAPQSGEIAAVITESGDTTLKRLFWQDGDDAIRLRALSDDYPDQFVKMDDTRIYPVCQVVAASEAVVVGGVRRKS